MGSRLATAALLLALAAPVQAAEPPAQALSEHAGDEAYRSRHFQDAASLYAQALPGAATDAELWYKLGATRAAMRDGPGALNAWRGALALAPERALIYRHASLLSMGMARRGQLRLRAAWGGDDSRLADARAALAADAPARALDALGDLSGAVPSWLRGEAALALGLLTDARGHFEAALASDPKHRAAKGGLAETLLRQDEDARATPLVREWLGDRPVSPEAFSVERARELAEELRAP